MASLVYPSQYPRISLLADWLSGVSIFGRVVFLDTETTGLAGGTGTLAFLLGLGWVLHDKFRVTQYLLARFASDKGMLEKASEMLRRVQTVVA